jgi:hypothetical protein
MCLPELGAHTGASLQIQSKPERLPTEDSRLTTVNAAHS